MKVLILSCNTGGGHNAAAQAIAEAIREHGECAEVLDYLSLAGKGVSKLVGDGYVKVVKKAPAMFGVAYKLGMVVSRLMKKSPVYYANARMARYLKNIFRKIRWMRSLCHIFIRQKRLLICEEMGLLCRLRWP